MKHVLVVEDDKHIAMALRRRLEGHGYKVSSVPDAVNAMTEAVRDAPDVVVMDINLPGGNGLMVAERLLQDAQTTDVPVIFITASLQPRLRERAAELSAVAFLEKPFTAGALLDALELAESRHVSDDDFLRAA